MESELPTCGPNARKFYGFESCVHQRGHTTLFFVMEGVNYALKDSLEIIEPLMCPSDRYELPVAAVKSSLAANAR